MIVADLLAEYPELLALVAFVLRSIRAWQTSLTWPEYRLAHRTKRVLFPILDRTPVVRDWLLWVSQKGGRSDPEFIATIDAGFGTVARHLIRGGGSPHLLNSLKRRPDTHGDPLTQAHVVWTHDDGTQTEAYLHANDDGSTDVSAHHEPSTDHPLRHLTGGQANGDVRGVVVETLATRWGTPVE